MSAKHPAKLTPRLRFPEFRGKDKWHTKPLRKCCERITKKVGDAQLTPVSISAGVGFVAQDQKFGRDISGAQYSKYTYLRRGEFAYNRGNSKRFPQGCVYQLHEFDEAAASNAFFCFRLNKEHEPDYFLSLFESNVHGRQLLRAITSGVRSNGLLNINTSTFYDIKIPLPTNPAEQRKIAACLGSLDDWIAAEVRALAALRRHKTGLVQQLFPRPGETRPRLRFPEFRDAGEWEERKIGDLEPFITSGSRGWAKYYADAGSLFVRITNLKRKSIYLDLESRKHVALPPVTSEGERTELRHGDILISVTADIGIVGYVDNRVPLPAYINQHIALVRFPSSIASPEFVARYLASDVSQAAFRSATDSGTKAGMGLAGVSRLPLMLPEPAERHRITDCLASLDARLSAQAVKLAALRNHKRGLMQQLFPSPEGN